MLRTLAIAMTVLLISSACGSSDSAAGVDSSEVDRDAWRTELTSLDDVGTDPDLDKLEELTREDCDSDVSDLALKYSLSGARPDVAKVNMKYVCPASVGKIDEALEQQQDASSEVDEACATDPAMRTETQSQLAEAMACD